MLRPILDSDTPIINEWIARDPDHAARGESAAFFRKADTYSFAIDDKAGPIMYLRLDPLCGEIVRIHIQFNETQRRRTAVALARDFPLVRELLLKSQLKYMIFDSVSEPLAKFCQKHFGFIHLPESNEYLLTL